MPRQKNVTPQELYRARKAHEEKEGNALLPPGLVNHGNTCFMNSVLQGLIATQYLEQLAMFKPIPLVLQSSTDTPVASHRSPELTNGHGVGGEFERPQTDGLTICDTFINLMLRAWNMQNNGDRDSLSPRPILAALGQKYDQYLDFRQQDAHEFLRQLLDAMRTEETDTIKRRLQTQSIQKLGTPSDVPDRPPSVHSKFKNTSQIDELPQQTNDKPMSFVDMLFGGKLTSILVCQTCKHVSHTYEDFNDLSLSIKAEDYMRERKRDKIKQLAKKLRNISSSALAAVPPVQRSSSVPATPARDSLDSPEVSESPRRRSIDLAEVKVQVHPTGEEKQDGTDADAIVTPIIPDLPVAVASPPISEPTESIPVTEPSVTMPPQESAAVRVSSETSKASGGERKNKDDGWVKLSRRISATVGLSRNSRESSRTQREEKKAKNSSPSKPSPRPTEEPVVPRASTSVTSTHEDANFSGSPSTSMEREPTPTSMFLVNEKLQVQLAGAGMKRSLSTNQKCTGNPPEFTKPSPKRHKQRPPKPSAEEAAYLRDVLADIHPQNITRPFSFFRQSKEQTVANSGGFQGMLLKFGQLGGIEECLRLFTSVEVLDGENMVRCRRCWKIAHGVYKPSSTTRSVQGSDSWTDSDDDDTDYNVHPSSRSPSRHDPETISAELGFRLATTGTPSKNQDTHIDDTSHMNTDISLPDCATKTSKLPPPVLQLNDCSTLDDTQFEKSHPSQQDMLVPSISTAVPQSPHSVKTARPTASRRSTTSSFVTRFSPATASSKGASLNAPFDWHRRDKDRISDSATESDGVSEDSDMIYVCSDISSAASPAFSRNVSQEHLESILQPLHATPSKIQRDNCDIARPKQVLMRPAYKRYLIATPPPILVIHLKRFQQSSKTPVTSFASSFKKLDDYISFPEYLDLTPYLAPKREDYFVTKVAVGRGRKRIEPCMYRLYAVVVHIGNMLGGHYVAYTALPSSTSQSDPCDKDQQSAGRAPRDWAYISDTVVRLVSFEEVMKTKAYICMYERI